MWLYFRFRVNSYCIYTHIQWQNCPTTSEVTLQNTDGIERYLITIKHHKAQFVFIFHGLYCNIFTWCIYLYSPGSTTGPGKSKLSQCQWSNIGEQWKIKRHRTTFKMLQSASPMHIGYGVLFMLTRHAYWTCNSKKIKYDVTKSTWIAQFTSAMFLIIHDLRTASSCNLKYRQRNVYRDICSFSFLFYWITDGVVCCIYFKKNREGQKLDGNNRLRSICIADKSIFYTIAIFVGDIQTVQTCLVKCISVFKRFTWKCIACWSHHYWCFWNKDTLYSLWFLPHEVIYEHVNNRAYQLIVHYWGYIPGTLSPWSQYITGVTIPVPCLIVKSL